MHNVPLGVCGEMGGRTLEAMALIGIGIRRLSITPVGVGPVKAMIRSLDAGACTAALSRLLKHPPEDFRGALAAWAEKHGVSIG
jgi:phosphotransferase system enzyme I (PtsP)